MQAEFHRIVKCTAQSDLYLIKLETFISTVTFNIGVHVILVTASMQNMDSEKGLGDDDDDDDDDDEDEGEREDEEDNYDEDGADDAADIADYDDDDDVVVGGGGRGKY
jgi:hypothetical protein